MSGTAPAAPGELGQSSVIDDIEPMSERIRRPATVVSRDERNELHASGATPNQHSGTPGLPHYRRDNAVLVDTDLVLWHNLSFHHVPVAEDYPLLSRESGAFELVPSNLFDRNPALDPQRAPFEVQQGCRCPHRFAIRALPVPL